MGRYFIWRKMETKICTKCHKELPISDFYVRKDASNSPYYSACKKCILEREKLNPNKKEWHKKYYQENKEYFLSKARESYNNNLGHVKEYKREYGKKHKDKLLAYHRELGKRQRSKFLEMYGNKCSCCGEILQEFLTIEHIQGQIGIKRSKKNTGQWAYAKAIKEYRPDLYEILCWNCNCSKGRYGYCPHKK